MESTRFARRARLSAAFAVIGMMNVGFSAASQYGADRFVRYVPGSAPTPGYKDPAVSLGPPERFTGELFQFPGVVSVFNPAFGPDELVSVGEGGELVLEFFEPVTNDVGHLFGADLILFGNGGFADSDYPKGRTYSPARTFGMDSVRVAVSLDGIRFVDLPGTYTEGFFPAQGYVDAGPYDTTPGQQLTDFQRPVNPALTLADFDGKTLDEVLALYDGSGGGTPIDISSSGMDQVRFVRLFLPDDGNPDTQLNFEVDALVEVPEPGTALLFGGVLAMLGRTARTRFGRRVARR